MLQMDLPHLNVLTKIDNLVNYPPLAFNLDFYTEVQDLSYLLPQLDAERSGNSPPNPDDESEEPEEENEEESRGKFHALNKAIIDLVEDFSLVSFETVAVEDKASMANLLRVIDRAGGYVFGGEGGANDSVWQVAMSDRVMMDVKDVQERWIDRREEFDELERRQAEEEMEAQERMYREAQEGEEGEGDAMQGMEGAEDLGLPPMPGGMSGVKVIRKPPAESKG
jgi:GPN-loop GTPase